MENILNGLRPYKLSTVSSIDQIEAVENSFDRDEINPEEFLEAVGHNIPSHTIDDFNCIILLEPGRVKGLISFFKKHGLEVNLSDAAGDIFNGEIDISNCENELLKVELERYVLKNYETDDILDKFLSHEKGTDSITPMDKIILERDNKKAS
jgi:hypothetical protein